jgi:uncharacterized SAM-binding protein YcdF (DUF218 family)
MNKLAKFIMLLLLSWLIGLQWFINQIPAEPVHYAGQADIAVVLTGGKNRLVTGIHLLEEGKVQKLLISGANKTSNIDDFKMLSSKAITKQMSRFEQQIIIGHIADDTLGNALETSILVKLHNYHSLYLVTSNYHLPRSLLVFNKIIPNVKIIPIPVFSDNFKIKAWWKSLGMIKLTISEYNKFIISKLT